MRTIALAVILAGIGLTIAASPARARSAGDANDQTRSKAPRQADPSHLIDPDTAATAIEVREIPHFQSIKVVPISQSGNSRALVRTVLEDDSARDSLHEAVRSNGEMMKLLRNRSIAVDDIVAVTTDRDNNAIVYTR